VVTKNFPGRCAGAFWLWAGAGGLVCIAMSRLEPSLLEEGLLLHVGERMLAGEHPYRDVVLTTGPVPYAMVTGLFALFEPSIAVARSGVALLHALATGAVYALGRRAGAGSWAHAAAACIAVTPVFFFPLISTAFYTTVATNLAIISAWLALRGVGSAGWAFTAGVAMAATALSKQSMGVLLAVSVVPSLILCAPAGARLRRGFAVCAGGAAATVTTLVVFAALGDLEVFVRSLVALPRGQVFASSFINLWPPGILAPDLAPRAVLIVPEVFHLLRDGRADPYPASIILITQILYALPLAGLVLTLVARMTRPLPPALWMFACANLACASNLFPRADAGHLAFAAPLAFAYAVCLAAVWVPGNRSLGSVSRVAAGLAVLALAVTASWTGARLYERSGDATWGPRVTVRPVNPSKRAGAVPRVIRYLRERLATNEAIFVARTEPLLYFATGARNPTPFTGLLQVWGTRGDQQDEILGALEDVRFVVMSDTDGMHTFYAEELPAVQEELERRFHVPETFTGRTPDEDWLMVLERGRDRGPTSIDLADTAVAPDAWLRQADGRQTPAPLPATRIPIRQNRRPMALELGPRGGGADWEFVVPEDARFQVSVGFRRIHGWRQPNRLRFEVKVSEGEGFRTLGVQRVSFDPSQGAGRRWSDLDIDLSALAGRRVVLRLEAVPAKPPKAGRVALWGSPRITGSAER
jgi:hypothetical protein